jgi:hypothetical protein
MPTGMPVEVSFCIVNTEQRERLTRCLDAVAAERVALPFETEVLVLDNASRDGSAGAARMHRATDRVIRLDARRGKAENATTLVEQARGRFVLLLDDIVLLPGATAVLHAALTGRDDAAAAGPAFVGDGDRRAPSAWRFPSPGTALLTALWLHPLLVVQSRGDRPRAVDWCMSSALMLRREDVRAAGGFDSAFFLFSDEVDLCRRLRDAGRVTLFVPGARVRAEPPPPGPDDELARRIVELARNRDRYMRKHHSAGAARAVRWLTAWSYVTRTVGAVPAPGHDPRRYARHARATLRPDRGEGLAEAAADFNRGTRL